MARTRDFGPVQLAKWLGLAAWQVAYARERGLVPPPDVTGGRWSEALAKTLPERADEIREAVGDRPGLGSVNAAAHLAAHSGLAVERTDILELVALGALRPVGRYRGSPVYAVRDLEALPPEQVSAVVGERLAWIGSSATVEEAARLLGWSAGLFEVRAERAGLVPRADGRYARAAVRELADWTWASPGGGTAGAVPDEALRQRGEPVMVG
ncbi:hypothetical protein [Streptomyces avicenniae]|uniref:hypothetical protein n=1 Tax=Streptomyces avicenniae TaxID=500153 RepID=UPI0006995C6C|nr:hypothetical protein [Streptomyces avicenniae]